MGDLDKSVYSRGIRFECTGCGECCKSRGRFQYVYVSADERRELARHLGLSTAEFTRRHCRKSDGWFHLRGAGEACQFLDGLRCTVYAARPQQCRSWPFWPDNMKARVWAEEVKPGCPGVGRGRRYSPQEIEVTLEAERERALKV